jgi:hypothetical protein
MIKVNDIYKEVFSRISTLPYNVYDELPQNPSNPHIRVDYSYTLDKSGTGYNGIIYYQYVHVYSTYKGRSEVLQIADEVVDALSEDIITEDFVAYPEVRRREIYNESANIGGQKTGYHINESYRHAIIVFRYVVYENNK